MDLLRFFVFIEEEKILAYADVGLSVSDIAKKVGISEEEVKTILLNEKE